MDKSNVAFALITGILGLYISVALLLSRTRGIGRRRPSNPRPESRGFVDSNRRLCKR